MWASSQLYELLHVWLNLDNLSCFWLSLWAALCCTAHTMDWIFFVFSFSVGPQVDFSSPLLTWNKWIIVFLFLGPESSCPAIHLPWKRVYSVYSWFLWRQPPLLPHQTSRYQNIPEIKRCHPIQDPAKANTKKMGREIYKNVRENNRTDGTNINCFWSQKRKAFFVPGWEYSF